MNAPATAAALSPPPISAELAIASIVASKTNPRKHFDKGELAELTASIKAHGVLQPILVRATSEDAPSALRPYEVVAGERRYRAAKAAGLATIPAIVRNLTDLQVLEIQVIENLQRANLHPLEEAEGYEALRKCDPTYNADLIAGKVGKSRSYVFGRMKLTALCPEAREAFYKEKLTASTALLIARIPAPKLQIEAMKMLDEEVNYDDQPLSYREAAELIQHRFMLKLAEAPFNIKDATLVPQAGACGPCPHRTGNQVDLFSDVKNANVCTDPSCFAAKKEAHLAQRRKEFEASGRKVIAGAEAKKLIPSGYSAPPNGYLTVDNAVDDGNEFRTAGELAKKLEVATTLIEHPKTKELVEVIAEGALQAAMKKAGLVRAKSSASTSYQDESAMRAKKAKAETAIRTRLLEAIHAAPAHFARDDWIRIAQAFFDDIWNDNRKRVLTLWGWADVKEANFREKDKALIAHIEALQNEELVRFLLDCALVKQVHVGAYDNTKCDELEAAATRRGIDVAALRAEVKKASKEKTKAKNASAKKTAAAKPRTAKTKPNDQEHA